MFLQHVYEYVHIWDIFSLLSVLRSGMRVHLSTTDLRTRIVSNVRNEHSRYNTYQETILFEKKNDHSWGIRSNPISLIVWGQHISIQSDTYTYIYIHIYVYIYIYRWTSISIYIFVSIYLQRPRIKPTPRLILLVDGRRILTIRDDRRLLRIHKSNKKQKAKELHQEWQSDATWQTIRNRLK